MTKRIISAGLLGTAALGLAASLAAQTTPPAAAPAPAAAPQVGVFPDGQGKETLLRVCSACHAPEVVTMQRHTEKDWAGIVELMAGNGAQGTDAEFAEITAYLAKNFPAGD